ncbi:MAG: DUF2950 domain-containing protein [Terriglobales bacterium]
MNMRRMKLNFNQGHHANLPKLALAAIILAACFPASVVAQQHGQKTFLSAEDATNALVTATKNNDEKALLEILGPDGKQIVSSGDEAEDAQSRANFVERYQQMHRLMKEPDGTTVLYIGAHNWPTPIPLMQQGKVWYFDTEAGKKEILYRRIGRNELSAIRVCQELAASQKEYWAQHGEYARKIFSDNGQQDGLYWRAANGEPESPIGPLVASAAPQSFAQSQSSSPTPYRGYYFHILTAEGAGNKKGVKSYLVDGKMTAGFAFVAYPAEYRSSGVVTFIVNQDGIVYEKDLGPKTESIARNMKGYGPTAGWQKSEGQQQEMASEPATQAK